MSDTTGLPVVWEWCQFHNWKHETIPCPTCRAEKAERKCAAKDERVKALGPLAEIARRMAFESDGGYGNMTTALVRQWVPDSKWEGMVRELILAARALRGEEAGE